MYSDYFLVLTQLIYYVDLNSMILYHIDIKIQRGRKYIKFFVKDMKCITFVRVSQTEVHDMKD